MKGAFIKTISAVLIVIMLFLTPLQAWAQGQTVIIADGTPVNIMVTSPIKSNKTGPFMGEVMSDVYSEDMENVLIKKGAHVTLLAETEKNGCGGKAGLITITSATVDAVDGKTILLNIPGYQVKGSDRKSLAWGLAAGIGLWLFPGFAFVLIKGNNAEIPAGSVLPTAYVRGVYKVDLK